MLDLYLRNNLYLYIKSQEQTKNTMKNSYTYLEAKAKAKIFNAYAENFEYHLIIDEGFNSSNGIVYIVLENGVHICASYAKSEVFYVILNDSEEYGQISFYNIEELETYLTNQN